VRQLDPELFVGLPAVEKVLRNLSPFKLVAGSSRRKETDIDVSGRKIGGRAYRPLQRAPAPSRGRR
jgi:hypothetical protein